ncbi:MAG TPA: NADH-quinone oxidoreductase subunit NuoH [Gemmatimonadaceae bacterium]|nr:NADH-quinone oxidoreductase subunit NuoH [Gemmatimonadaceae bacterium]
MTLGPGIAALLQAADPQREVTTGVFIVFTIVKMLAVFSVYMVTVAMLTLAERKIAAWIQDRKGPNRVGPGGLLQPAADGLKNFMKEESEPAGIYKPIFVLAPALSFIPALIAWAVIPFAAPLPTPWGLVDMVVADLPIGYLFVVAISSLGVYGVTLAGWSSNNKYALLGGLRASAQMVSYEIALGMSIIPVLLLAGNVTLSAVVAQQMSGWWNVLNLTLGWIIFLIAAFAETNRLPFDLPEAESELVAGYHTEYSSMKFSMFFIAEYAAMMTMSALMATLFFGGWDIPFTSWDNVPPWSVLKTVLTLLAFAAKVGFFIFTYMWVRWTLPRFRYDQLMALGWRVLLPLVLVYIVIVAGVVLALDAAGVTSEAVRGAVLLGVNILLLVVVFGLLDRGRMVSPASGRLSDEELAQLRSVGRHAPRSAYAGD